MTCKAMAIDQLIQAGQPQTAISHFHTVFPELCSDPLLRFQIPGKILTACIAYVQLGDWVRLQAALQSFANEYPAFEATREFAFIRDLVGSALDFDAERYQAVLDEYVRLSPLDNFKLSVLVAAKESIATQDLT
jgi:alpha-soluble NSF attachment protein